MKRFLASFCVIAGLLAGCEFFPDDPTEEARAATPEPSVEAGDVADGTKVTLYCATEGAAIYYTVGGSTPDKTNTGQLYDGRDIPISGSGITTIKAIAVMDGLADSEMLTAAYTVVAAVTVTISPWETVVDGILSSGEDVTISKSGGKGYGPRSPRRWSTGIPLPGGILMTRPFPEQRAAGDQLRSTRRTTGQGATIWR